MIGSGAGVDSKVSVGMVLWQRWTVGYLWDWYWGSSGLCRVNRTGTGAVVDCRVSVGLSGAIMDCAATYQ